MLRGKRWYNFSSLPRLHEMTIKVCERWLWFICRYYFLLQNVIGSCLFFSHRWNQPLWFDFWIKTLEAHLLHASNVERNTHTLNAKPSGITCYSRFFSYLDSLSTNEHDTVNAPNTPQISPTSLRLLTRLSANDLVLMNNTVVDCVQSNFTYTDYEHSANWIWARKIDRSM